jgi:DnaK suppressor protein
MFARSAAQSAAVAAVGPAGYNSALSRLKGIEDQPLVAAKKPVKKAVKAAKKTSRTATAVKKPVAKKSAAQKPAAKKLPAKKPVAKKPVAKKPAPSKKVAATKAPAKAAAKKPLPAKKPAPAKKPVAPVKAASTRKAPVVVAPARSHKPVPAPVAKSSPAKSVAKSSGKPATKTAVDPKSAAGAKPVTNSTSPINVPRPIGKVAVAVVARQAAPVARTKFKVVPYKNDPATGRPIIPAGYKPSSEEEYMGPLQVEYFRQRLVSWRSDLVEESKQTIENLKDEVRDVGDEAERATRETENSLELRTRDRYRKLIGKIDSTLKRLDSGEYGYSVDSGEEIGLERLEARLTAERTIDEQERWEHLQKQIGD